MWLVLSVQARENDYYVQKCGLYKNKATINIYFRRWMKCSDLCFRK